MNGGCGTKARHDAVAGSGVVCARSEGHQDEEAAYYLPVTGTIGVIALANAHSNNSSIAAVIGVVNSYSTLQANIGAHDPNRARLLALYRLLGNIPGANGVIRLHCAGGTPP